MRLSRLDKIRFISKEVKDLQAQYTTFIIDKLGDKSINNIKGIENSLEWLAMLELYDDLPNLSDNAIFTKTTNIIYDKIQVLKRDRVVGFENFTLILGGK
jgi:hypothetical protein